MKNKCFEIKLSIYPQKIFVVFGEFNKQLTKLLLNTKHPSDQKHIDQIIKSFNDDDKYAAITLLLDNGNIIIHFKDCEKDCLYEYIPHEALHAVNDILKYIGMGKLSNSTGEAYCYLLGYITKEIFTNYLKK